MKHRPEPLPETSILFHAGFHKTGTTAIQSALASSRDEMLAHGVLYPGKRRSHHRAAMVVTNRTWGWEERGGRRTNPAHWTKVVAEVADHPSRVVISSEAFALADDQALDRIIAELVPPEGLHPELHVVLTLRPMARLLSSSWQQYLKYGLSMGYESWLRSAFVNPPACPPTPNFWRRNDHAGIAERWAERVGPQRVHLVIPDEADRGFLMRTFEGLLDLPSGLLVPDPSISAGNRSMTAAEAELLRRVNAGGVNSWEWPKYEKLVRRGAIMRLVEGRRPDPGEEPVGTPQWAVDAAAQHGERTAERIAALGAIVHGDLGSLGQTIPAGQAPSGRLTIPVSAASEALLGALTEAMTLLEPTEPAGRPPADPLASDAVKALTTADAAALLRRRVAEARHRRVARAGAALRRPFRRRAEAAGDSPPEGADPGRTRSAVATGRPDVGTVSSAVDLRDPQPIR